MARFDSAIALALRLIKKSGEVGSLIRKTDGAPADVTKPWLPGTPTEATHAVNSVWLSQRVLRREGDMLPEGHMSVLLPASGLTVTPNAQTDRIVRASGEVWTIVSVETLSPNGQLIMHELEVSR